MRNQRDLSDAISELSDRDLELVAAGLSKNKKGGATCQACAGGGGSASGAGRLAVGNAALRSPAPGVGIPAPQGGGCAGGSCQKGG